MLHDVQDQDNRSHPQGEPGMSFSNVGAATGVANTGGGTPGFNTQPNPRPDVTCHKCGKTGHFSNKCAETTHTSGTALVVVQADSGDSSDAASITSAPSVPPSASVLSGNDALSTLLGVVDPSTEALQFLNNGTVNEGYVWSQHKAATRHAVP
jgi:hypothetical protein